MEPTHDLVNALYRDRILRARAMSPEEQFLAGPRIFARVCRIMEDGIRAQFPDADALQVREILRQRLARLRRLEGSR